MPEKGLNGCDPAAWGEVRYQSGTLPTDKTYTGQRSFTDDFGLMYYNARWYDAYLNHFTQPDSIIPPGLQGLDRYAYANNNPVNYTDPSGHCSVGGNWQEDSSAACIWIFDTTMKVTFASGSAGDWTDRNKMIVRQAVWDAARAEGAVLGTEAQEAFNKVHNGVTFTWGNGPATSGCANFGVGGCTTDTHHIYFHSLAEPNQTNKSPEEATTEAITNVVHELGHSFAAKWYPADLTKPYDPAGPNVNIPDSMLGNDGFYPGPEGASLTWRQHPCTAKSCLASEAFADMYVGWVYHKWDNDIKGVGSARDQFMTTNMTEWLKGLK